MAGYVVKDRLVKLLDHPSLVNHLLRVLNLLTLLGWREAYQTRHNRALHRHISSLVKEGTIERLEVGDARVRCIRLTKYNSQTIPRARIREELPVTTRSPKFENVSTAPFNYAGIASNVTVEHYVQTSIVDMGLKGLTLAVSWCISPLIIRVSGIRQATYTSAVWISSLDVWRKAGCHYICDQLRSAQRWRPRGKSADFEPLGYRRIDSILRIRVIHQTIRHILR